MWYMCLKVSSPSVFQKTINHQPTTNNEFVYLRSPFNGRVAEWLGTALQKLLLRFESARDLDRRAPRFPGRSRFGWVGDQACLVPRAHPKRPPRPSAGVVVGRTAPNSGCRAIRTTRSDKRLISIQRSFPGPIPSRNPSRPYLAIPIAAEPRCEQCC